MNKELAEALEKLKALGGEDIMAIACWLRGEGRKALRERGATDKEIGVWRQALLPLVLPQLKI